MTRSSASMALAVAAMLMGCADDSTRLAGGTGSDLPRPVARLLDTNLLPINAGTWRLWNIRDGWAYPDSQISNPVGFEVPDTGMWLVEAWMDSAHAGSFEHQTKTPTPAGIGLCAHNLTYMQNGDSRTLGVQPCLVISAPSLANGSEKPLGVGVFGSDTIKRVVRITNRGLDANRFIVWKRVSGSEWRNKNDSLVRTFRWGFRYSELQGTVDIQLPQGDWLLEGWGPFAPGVTKATWEAGIPDSMSADADRTGWGGCQAESFVLCDHQISKYPAMAAPISITVHVP